MTTTTTPPANVAQWRSQFAYPTGWLGSLVGHVMAIKSRERSLWVLSLLDLQSDDRVLEIGFGPGVDIHRVSKIVAYVAGIDHSAAMVRQARRRNRVAILAGKVDVRQGSAAGPLPNPDGRFTKVFSINSFQFWPDPDASLRELRRVLQPGGLIALAVQPRGKGATNEDSRLMGERLRERLSAAGFSWVHLASKAMKPTAVVCAMGTK
jgi:SAM-dependent methyltransferase